jgi:uncharacterized repeat protein (TIGR01451 family)
MPIRETDIGKKFFKMRLVLFPFSQRSSITAPSSRSRTISLLTLTLVFMSGGAALPLFAAETVTTHLSATKRVQTKDKQGHITTSFVPFTKALPGDDVVYTVTCHNQSQKPAGDVVITLPVPAELTFTPGSVSGEADVTYSVDEGKTFGLLENLVISAPDGASRPARVDDIKMISWKLRTALAPAGDAQVSFHALVK